MRTHTYSVAALLFSLSAMISRSFATVIPSGIPNSFDTIESFLDYAPDDSCTPLSIGETRILNVDDYASVTTVEKKHSLTKKSEDEYEIGLYLNFFSYQNPKFDADAWHSKASRCIQWVQGYLGEKGSNRKLILKLYNSKTILGLPKKLAPPLVNIEIDPKRTRSNSRQYSETASCSTIIHELFHLLGLPDLYEEKGDNGTTINPYACRMTVPFESIMNDHRAVLRFPNSNAITCTCEGRKECLNELAIPGFQFSAPKTAPGQIDCPPPFVGGYVSLIEGIQPGEVRMTAESVTYGSLQSQPKHSLHPAEFNSIIMGNCYSNDDRFSKCARFAYSRLNAKQCDQAPDYCKTPGDWFDLVN